MLFLWPRGTSYLRVQTLIGTFSHNAQSHIQTDSQTDGQTDRQNEVREWLELRPRPHWESLWCSPDLSIWERPFGAQSGLAPSVFSISRRLWTDQFSADVSD